MYVRVKRSNNIIILIIIVIASYITIGLDSGSAR